MKERGVTRTDRATGIARGERVWGRVYSVLLRGRSRMAIAIRPYNTGTEHVGLSPTRQTLLAPSAKRREVFGESHEGRATSY